MSMSEHASKSKAKTPPSMYTMKTKLVVCVNMLEYKVFLTMYLYVLMIYSNQPYIEKDKYTK